MAVAREHRVRCECKLRGERCQTRSLLTVRREAKIDVGWFVLISESQVWLKFVDRVGRSYICGSPNGNQSFGTLAFIDNHPEVPFLGSWKGPQR